MPRKTKEVDQENLRKWARLLDEQFTIPGTQIKVGLDAFIGLIPGIGDWLTSGFSFYVIAWAYGQGVPLAIILKMLINTLIDALLGQIPLLGDVFDIFWKNNVKNILLLNRCFNHPQQTTRRSAAWVVGFFCLLGFLFTGLFYLFWQVALLVLNVMHLRS